MEWTVFDPKRNDFTLVYAESQKEAIIKSAERGFVPGSSSDARPRTGDTELMSREEFESFMDE